MDKATELITAELFEIPIRKYFGDSKIKIIKCESVAAIPVGENFTSEIFRTTITYTKGDSNKQEKLSTIVKCFPNNDMMIGLIEEYTLFETEGHVYNNILPVVNNFLKKDEQVSARCICYEKHKNSDIIAFEDLSNLKFKMYPRRQGLDLKHCLLVVEKLACLHGTSLVLFQKDPTVITKYTKGIFRDVPFCTHWISTGLKALAEACAKWPGYEKYGKKLKPLETQIQERLAKSKSGSTFNVLNHGDTWINNMMFSYNSNGDVEDARLVDFQLVYYGSPNIDLQYFWASSPSIDVRLNNFDTIIDHYYKKLTDVVKRLDYPLNNIPSKKELLEDFHIRAFHGFAASVTTLPIVAAPSRDDATLEEMVDGNDDGYRHESYNNEVYRRYMEYLLPYFDKQGIFD